MKKMIWKAKWIWAKNKVEKPYNQTIIAKKEFQFSSIHQAELFITADSYYRLLINGQWVADGPARAWPEHYQYDKINVTSYLIDGSNEIGR